MGIRAVPTYTTYNPTQILLRNHLRQSGGTDQLVSLLQQFMSLYSFLLMRTIAFENSVLIQGHGCVIKQVAVAHQQITCRRM